MTSLVVIMYRIKATFSNALPYILVGVLGSLSPLSEVNALFHFLIYLLHLERYITLCLCVYYSNALVFGKKPYVRTTVC